MTDELSLYVFESLEVQEVLAGNNTDLVELLQMEGIRVERRMGKDPTYQTGSSEKDPTGLIIASAMLILAITPLVSKVLSAISNKKVVVRERICIPVEDSKGNIVRDSNGEPILQWVDRAKYLESSEVIPPNYEISLKGPLGIEVFYAETPTSEPKLKGTSS